jgi:DNA mismatch repair ATPase MutS
MSKDDAKKKFQRLRNELMEDHNKVMRSLYANGLGYIDCMIGIQVAVRQGNLAMPTGCSRGEAFTVRNARSPFVTDPVAIDLDGSNAHPQFIISGANKSGKTEAIRTLQAIILLAKEKLPVPADARIPGYDRTLTFFGEKEHMEKSESYFRSVSKRLLSILEDATKDSIVIMDELHGSDYWELSALQAAVIRYLDTIGATVVLNTHMREGLALIRDCSSVRFMKTDTIRNPDDTLTFNYALLPDKKLTAKSYGIESVRNYLTDDQTRRAFAIRQGLETIEEMRKRSYPVSDVLKSA